MPKKKKKFIDKKNAKQFVVVHRSQQDPLYNDPTASKFVLQPVNQRAIDAQDRARKASRQSEPTKTDSTKRRLLGDRVDELGLPLDGYDYSQHLKPMGKGGTFVGANGLIASSLADVYNKTALPADAFGSETLVGRREQLEAIALDTARMPADMREVLDFGDPDDRFEELQDDFMVVATEEVEGDADGPAPFDFKAHMAKLLAMEDEKEMGRPADPRSDEDDEDIELMNAVRDEAPRQDRIIDGHFDVVLKQYEDEEIGELDEDDPRVTEGLQDMQSRLLLSAIADFEETEDKLKAGIRPSSKPAVAKDNEEEDSEEEGATKDGDAVVLPGNSALSAAIAKAMARSRKGRAAKAAVAAEGEDEEEEESEEDDEAVMNDTWFKRKPKNQWDAATIVSTYSNLDNRPALITARSAGPRIRLSKKTGLPLSESTRRRRKDKQKQADASDALAAAAMNRLQLAAGVAPHIAAAAMDFESFESCTGTITSKRAKGETSAERRQRKKLVKAERKARRREKKQTSRVYKAAGKNLRKHETTNKMAGKTIVHF